MGSTDPTPARGERASGYWCRRGLRSNRSSRSTAALRSSRYRTTSQFQSLQTGHLFKTFNCSAPVKPLTLGLVQRFNSSKGDPNRGRENTFTNHEHGILKFSEGGNDINEAAQTLDDFFSGNLLHTFIRQTSFSSGQTKPSQFFIRPSNICDHPFERTDWKAVA